MFTKGQSGELAWVTSSNIPSPLYLFWKVLPPVYVYISSHHKNQPGHSEQTTSAPEPPHNTLQSQFWTRPFSWHCCLYLESRAGQSEFNSGVRVATRLPASGLNTRIYCARWLGGLNNCLFCLEPTVDSECRSLVVK